MRVPEATNVCDCYLEYTRSVFVVQTFFRINEHRYLGIAAADHEQLNSESAFGKGLISLDVVEDDVHLRRILRMQHMRHHVRMVDSAESLELNERGRDFKLVPRTNRRI